MATFDPKECIRAILDQAEREALMVWLMNELDSLYDDDWEQVLVDFNIDTTPLEHDEGGEE